MSQAPWRTHTTMHTASKAPCSRPLAASRLPSLSGPSMRRITRSAAHPAAPAPSAPGVARGALLAPGARRAAPRRASAAATEPAAVEATGTGLPVACSALIVGGGPAGLAAALQLSARGWRDVVVLERRESVEYADIDRWGFEGAGPAWPLCGPCAVPAWPTWSCMAPPSTGGRAPAFGPHARGAVAAAAPMHACACARMSAHRLITACAIIRHHCIAETGRMCIRSTAGAASCCSATGCLASWRRPA
jgi:hypothetical protein